MSTRATVKNFQNTDNPFACATFLFWLIKFSRYSDTAKWRLLLVLKCFYWLFTISIGKPVGQRFVQMESENPQCNSGLACTICTTPSEWHVTRIVVGVGLGTGENRFFQSEILARLLKQILLKSNCRLRGEGFKPRRNSARPKNPQTRLGISARPNGLKNPCNRINFFHPRPQKEREHAYRLCFRTSVNFLMEFCVLRSGWNWACNHNNISARAETYHVIRLLDVSKILENLEHRNSITIYIPTEISETFWLMVNKHCDL